MRKVLSFVLVLSLVLGSFGMVFAAPLSDVAGEDFEDAVNALTQLEVVSGYPDGTYRPDNIVTRAEMAVIVVRALGLADYAVGTSSFKDMGGHWSNPYVAYANALGVIAGYPNGEFRPDNTVSYDEAATMLVAALGYTPDSLVGTWPANYVVKAKALGIMDGIKVGAAGANRGDIAIMSFQTLGQDIGKVDKNGKWEENGTAEKPDTMLSRLGAKLDNEGKAFVLKDAKANAALINVKSYLGAYVKAYVDKDDKILAISSVESTSLTGEKLENGKFKADGVEYTISGAKYLGETTNSAVSFVNGIASGSAVAADITTSAGILTLAVDVSGKTIDEVYSVSVWDVEDNHKRVSEDDLDELTEKNPQLLDIKFKLNKNEEIDFKYFDLIGVDSLDDIKKDNVVYVYEGNEEITKIEVGTEVVEGTISRVQGEKYTISGNVYELSDCATEDAEALKVKDEVKLYLDANGDIYDAKLIEGAADLMGIVLGSHVGTGGLGADKDSLIKLFLFDESEKTFTVDVKKVKENSSGSGIDFADMVTTGGIALDNNVVKYGLDKDGKINKIEAAFDDPLVTSSSVKITEKGYIDGYRVASDAVVITNTTISGVTFETDGDDDFKVSTLDKVKDADYDAILYNVTDKNVIDFIVIAGAGSKGDEVYGIVKGKFETVDWDYGVEVYIDGVLKEYNADGDYDLATVYGITFDTDGDAKMVSQSAMSDGNGVTVSAVKNNRAELESGSTSIALDANVVVYIVDGTKVSVGKTGDLRGKVAYFYDTDKDNPDVATIVVVEK